MPDSFKKRNMLKGQSTMEYAGIILCVAAALYSMQFFVMRAMNGRIRVAGDQIGEQQSVLFTQSNFTEISGSKTKIYPHIYPLSYRNNFDKAPDTDLKDESGQKVYGLEVYYGIEESNSKTGDENISGY